MATVTTPFQLCNLALGLVGVRQSITNFTEGSDEAAACGILYGPSRDECLAARWWTFATKREVLALTAEERTGWEYAYTVPADMLVGGAQYIWTGQRNPPPDAREPFAIELRDDGGGHLLLCDRDEAELVYTAQLNTVALWPAPFVWAVATRLAANLAAMLTVKPDVALRLGQVANLRLAQAAAADGNSVRHDVAPESSTIRARG